MCASLLTFYATTVSLLNGNNAVGEDTISGRHRFLDPTLKGMLVRKVAYKMEEPRFLIKFKLYEFLN